MLRALESVTNNQLTQNIQQRKASYTGRILHKGRKSVNLGKMLEKNSASIYYRSKEISENGCTLGLHPQSQSGTDRTKDTI